MSFNQFIRVCGGFPLADKSGPTGVCKGRVFMNPCVQRLQTQPVA